MKQKFLFIALFISLLCGTSLAEENQVSSKADSTKAAPAITEPVKADSTKAAPAITEPVKADSAKAAPAITEPAVSASTSSAEHAQKYLHVLTNPFNADIFVNDSKPDFASRPDYVSPDFIKVPGSGDKVQITLYKRAYADTTINVTLSAKDTSYLIVSLREHGDPNLTAKQDKELSHRSRRNVGRNLIIASGVPFLASAITAYITHRYIESAKSEKDKVQNSLIRSGDRYEQHVSNYHDDRDNARTAKKVAATTLGTGLALLSLGIILSF